eukprot:Skav211826  [mRNA]  locus=scaffold305:614346:614591:+ [translate_table: standard]
MLQVSHGPIHFQTDLQRFGFGCIHGLIGKARADDQRNTHRQSFHETILASMRQENIHTQSKQIHLGKCWTAERIGGHLEAI